MREITISLAHVYLRKEFHEAVWKALGPEGENLLPDYYGKNLDALADALDEVSEPVQITFTEVGEAEFWMKPYLQRVYRMAAHVNHENPSVKILFK